MIIKYPFLSLLMILLCLPLTMTGQQYEQLRVAKIEVEVENLPSTTAFNVNAVRTRMQTKIGGYFSQNEFDEDLKMLVEEYDRIEPTIKVINNEIHITLQVWLKPIVRSIYFCGNEHVSTKKLKKKLELDTGSVFEREAFIKAFNALKLLYVKKGYFEAEFDYEIIPIEEFNQIDIHINICEGRAGKIKEIRFEGLTPREEDEIIELMLTKKYNLLLNWYTGRGIYHPEMIEHDRLQIINFLQDEGYADAMVHLCVEEAPQRDRIILVISIDKGCPYYIGEVTLSGNTLYGDEQIWKLCQIWRDGFYSPEKIRCTIQAISDLYGRCGYIDTTVDVQLSLRDDRPIYDIEIVIDEGEQYYVGLINVFGNCSTQTRVILNETLLCPGEIFSNRKLEATEARLCNTGLFEAVNVYAVTSQLDDPTTNRRYRDVYIEVEESDTGSMGLFFGFSSLDQLFGGFEISESNFNIAGATRLFERGPRALRGGGEYTHFKVNIGDRQTSYLLQWTKPYFMDTPWIVGVDLEKSDNRAISRAYDIKTYGGNVHATYIWNPYLKNDFHYRANHTHISFRNKNDPQILQEGQQSGMISAVGFSLIYDSTDRPRRPTRGLRSRFIYELAGVGGNYQFMRFSYLNAFYYPFSRRGTYKFRGDIQFVKTYGSTTPNELPLSERLFLGGETTVRGYRPFIIGPKFGPNEPRGGLSSYLISQEYQHNLLKMPCIDAFVFVDAGYVSFSEFTVGRQAASVGFGIRAEVMRNMPLIMGLGWPIHPTEKLNGRTVSNAQRFFFGVAGNF
ncbi:MAG: outer membrane protein assembly factor BamA [Chlamydiales bacterium]